MYLETSVAKALNAPFHWHIKINISITKQKHTILKNPNPKLQLIH